MCSTVKIIKTKVPPKPCNGVNCLFENSFHITLCKKKKKKIAEQIIYISLIKEMQDEVNINILELECFAKFQDIKLK